MAPQPHTYPDKLSLLQAFKDLANWGPPKDWRPVWSHTLFDPKDGSDNVLFLNL